MEENILTHVTDVAALRVLKSNNFFIEHSDDMYSDYLRLPHGWGEDGTDRNEKVSFIKDEGVWYPTADHIDLNGDEWHHVSGPTSTLEEAIAWLDKEAETAPKQIPGTR